MLNEFLIAERGARDAGIEIEQRHPDISPTARGVDTLRVYLNPDGHIAKGSPVPKTAPLWTLRDFNKNSFPFVRIKPLLDDVAIRKWDEWTEAAKRPKRHEQRATLLNLAAETSLRRQELGEWATGGTMRRLRERLAELDSLREGQARVVPAALKRFLRACDPRDGGDPARFLDAVRVHLIKGLTETASDDWIDLAAALLVAKGAIYIDAVGEWPLSLTDRGILALIGTALGGSAGPPDRTKSRCALTGDNVYLVDDIFPRCNLPIIGPTSLFSRFDQLPANDRYGRFGSDTIQVGEDLARRLAAAAESLTSPERRGITWRSIPGEAPKQTDLLLAFVESLPDAPIVGTLTDDEEDFSSEEPQPLVAANPPDSIATFEKRTERLLESIQGRAGADFRKTPVRLAVLRRVDPANRKVIYSGESPVGDLYDSAVRWSDGERNVPAGVTLPVLRQGERKPRPMSPPHVPPLGVISFTKQLFIEGGTRAEDVIGLPAAEALSLFLDRTEPKTLPARRRTSRVLRLVLARRTILCSRAAHALRRSFDAAKEFDRREVLRTVTMLGVLLSKSGRNKEIYMSQIAFKLGQLLAAADIVHAGYCADVRGGDVPPSLLGNQVFTMAQASPAKALATLCRRWKPYDGWAKRTAHDPDRIEALHGSKQKDQQQRFWEIKKALRHAREMKPLADEVSTELNTCKVDDLFRAELLLGYIAGLQKSQSDLSAQDSQSNPPKE